jgi:hypothetical protein
VSLSNIIALWYNQIRTQLWSEFGVEVRGKVGLAHVDLTLDRAIDKLAGLF